MWGTSRCRSSGACGVVRCRVLQTWRPSELVVGARSSLVGTDDADGFGVSVGVFEDSPGLPEDGVKRRGVSAAAREKFVDEGLVDLTLQRSQITVLKYVVSPEEQVNAFGGGDK